MNEKENVGRLNMNLKALHKISYGMYVVTSKMDSSDWCSNS